MKVRSASFPMTGAVGAIALAVALVAGSGLAPAAGMSAVEDRPAHSAASADAAAVLEAKTESVEAAGLPAAPALAAAALKTATPVATAKPAKKPRAARRPVASKSSGWKTARVSWYGPGFYGHTMAGGGKLTPTSMVVAHRTLPFGTKVEIEYKGRRVIAVVMDRGPFVRGRTFDLGPGTAKALGFSGVGTIRWRIVR